MIGIIVLNYNTPDDVFNCVDSIWEKTKTEYKIYLVDNNSTDNSFDLFLEKYEHSNITLLKSNQNNGFSAGNNIGIKKAIEDGCEYICLINADIVLVEDTISILELKLRDNQNIGIVAPSVFSPDSQQETQFARNKLTFGNFLAEKSFLKRFKGFVKKYPRYQVVNKSFDSDYIFFGMTYGCIYLLKSNFLVKTGYLDESVFLFNEEDILAYKLENEELKTMITPDTKVIHNHHSSISKTSTANRVFHFRVSELIVLRKYASTSFLVLLPIILVFNFIWFFKSIFSSDYRKRFGKFIKSTFGIIKIQKGSGLKY